MVVKSEEEAFKVENGIIIDLNKGIELLLEFNRKTVKFSKEFKKLVNKQKECDSAYQKKLCLKFVETNLFKIWEKEFGEIFFKDDFKRLDKEILYTYIFGTFVIGHSKKTQENLGKLYARVIGEMATKIQYYVSNSPKFDI